MPETNSSYYFLVNILRGLSEYLSAPPARDLDLSNGSIPATVLTKDTVKRNGKMRKLLALLHNDEGATMVEYGIMVALIAAVCIVLITTLGGSVSSAFQSVNTAI